MQVESTPGCPMALSLASIPPSCCWQLTIGNSAAVSTARQPSPRLSHIEVAVNGRILVAANRTELLQSILPPPAFSRARRSLCRRFRHSAELPNFVRMMRLIDNRLSQRARRSSPATSQVWECGRRLDSASIAVHDTGAIVTQDLRYKWKP